MAADVAYSINRAGLLDRHQLNASQSKAIDQEGFLRFDGWLTKPEIEHYRQLVDCPNSPDTIRTRGGATYATRQLLEKIPALTALAESDRMRGMIEPILGPSAFVARSILFDKTESANWMVAWHQDTTIAVREKASTPGYGPWSVKDGIVHVRPPARVLENMLTVRVHLDPTPAWNGALLVIPGSHRHGILSSEDIARERESKETLTCELDAGGIMLMRPAPARWTAGPTSHFRCPRTGPNPPRAP